MSLILVTRTVTKGILVGFMGMTLCGCEPKPPPEISGQNSSEISHPQTTDDCKLRQLAFDMTLQQTGTEKPSILVGCEGPHGDYIVSLSERERIKLADQNPPPQSVVSRGIAHEKLYQQLKARGVPASILLQIVDTIEYKAAANEVSTQRVI